jgi:RNA polymerase sigma factor (sigma-70 family)
MAYVSAIGELPGRSLPEQDIDHAHPHAIDFLQRVFGQDPLLDICSASQAELLTEILLSTDRGAYRAPNSYWRDVARKQRLLVAYYTNGMPEEEIAQRTNFTLNTFNLRIDTVVRRIKKAYDSPYYPSLSEELARLCAAPVLPKPIIQATPSRMDEVLGESRSAPLRTTAQLAEIFLPEKAEVGGQLALAEEQDLVRWVHAAAVIHAKKEGVELHTDNILATEEVEITRLGSLALEYILELTKNTRMYWANQLCGRGLERDELMTEGAIGVMRALARYSFAQNTRIKTYADPFVSGEMRHAIRDYGRTIRLPRRAYDDYRTAMNVRNKLLESTGQEPTVAEVVQHTPGMNEETTTALIVFSRLRITGWDDLADKTVEESSGLTYYPQPNPVSQGEVENYICSAKLTTQEEFVLRRRYGFPVEGLAYGPLALVDVARQAKLSESRVRTLERQALDKLRQVLLDT